MYKRIINHSDSAIKLFRVDDFKDRRYFPGGLSVKVSFKSPPDGGIACI